MSKLIIANWKQNKTAEEVKSWTERFSELLKTADYNNIKIIIAPVFPHLPLIKEFTDEKDYMFSCSQNVSKESGGRHTGEVSALQLSDFVDYCIIGHSETGESGEVVFKKGTLCLENGITPIMCFVDTANLVDIPNVVFAWEDPENITKKDGEFNPKSTEDIAEGIRLVKQKVGPDAIVVYGGSVNRQNAPELSNINELDGVLVGSASLDPDHFFDIVTAFKK